MKPRFSIALHGGAGTIRQNEMTAEKKADLSKTLKLALEAGIDILKSAGSAVEATAASVVIMENSPLFNAGKGSVFNHKGFVEMDASIMCGKTLNIGGVTCVRNIRNPILLSKEILLHNDHVLLAGAGAEDFARSRGLVFKDDDYFFTPFRYEQLQKARQKKRVILDHSPANPDKYGTVGAVALDLAGNLAAATSTGGMTNKLAGRVGDSPLAGSGNYANNKTCAVSCTGIGEGFIRAVSAYDVSALMEYKSLSLQEAAKKVVFEKLPLVGGAGGLIAVDKNGEVYLPFNTEGMYRAWYRPGEGLNLQFYEQKEHSNG